VGASTTLPMWVVLAPSIVSLVVGLLSVVVAWTAIRSTHRRELRAERREVYAKMARLTKVVLAEKPFQIEDLAEAHAEIQLLTDNQELVGQAQRLMESAAEARKAARDYYEKGIERPYSLPIVASKLQELNKQHLEFLRLAKQELGSTRPWWRFW
jgi:hypothetical protein